VSQEFANQLALDCYNNNFSAGATATARVDIAADGIADTESELSTRMGALPNFMFATLIDQCANMSLNCCTEVNSPLTMDSAFNFKPPKAVDDHDVMPQRVLDGTG
jgi:hypothetical protein